MARRSKSKSFKKPDRRRVNSFPNAKLRLHPVPRPLVSRFDLRPIEDRRTFTPAPLSRPARSVFRRADAKLVVSPLKSVRSALSLPARVAFAVPRRIALCIRRKVRKEVLMSKGVGGSRVRRPRRNEFSDVRC